MSLHNGLILGLLVGSSPYHTPSVSKIKNVGNWQPVEGGYRVSGIQHSEWVTAAVRVVQDGDRAPEFLAVVFPTSEATIHDNWQVMGLQPPGAAGRSQ